TLCSVAAARLPPAPAGACRSGLDDADCDSFAGHRAAVPDADAERRSYLARSWLVVRDAVTRRHWLRLRACPCLRRGSSTAWLESSAPVLPGPHPKGCRSSPAHCPDERSPGSSASLGANTSVKMETPGEIKTVTMTVVHLTSSRFFGGPERQMLGLAAHLA